MKMSKGLFEKLKKSLENVDYNGLLPKYEVGNFVRSEHVKDLRTRYCWDMLHMTNWFNDYYWEIKDEGLHDAHIYTALRKILPNPERKY